MGIIKKAKCCLCEKEIGIINRTKLQNGQYICEACKSKAHPFVHYDRCRKEDINQIIVQIQEEAEAYALLKDEVEQNQFECGTYIYKLELCSNKKQFTFESLETRNYEYHPVFEVDKVLPYTLLNRRTKVEGVVYTALSAKVDNKGKPRLYYVKFVYDDPRIQEVKIKFEGAYVKEARVFCNALNEFIQGHKAINTKSKTLDE